MISCILKGDFERMAGELVFSQKLIFLHQPIHKLIEQIINRGRSYEQKISQRLFGKN